MRVNVEFSSSGQLDIKRYYVEHEKRKSISTSSHVLFFNDGFFADFLKIFKHFQRFSKILQKLSEGQANVLNLFQKCPKISEENRKIFEGEPMIPRSGIHLSIFKGYV